MGVIENIFNELISLTRAIDREVNRGYDLSRWSDQMKFLHALQIQSQMLIGLFLRIACLLGYSPRTPLEASKYLFDEEVISEADYKFFRSVVGFRNIVVHEYTSVDMDIVENILGNREYRKVLVLAEKIYRYAREKKLDP